MSRASWMVVPSGATGVPKNVTGFLQFFTTNPIFAVTDYLRPLIALLRYEATVDLDSDSLRYLFYYLYAKLSSRHKLKSIQYMENHYAEQISVSSWHRWRTTTPHTTSVGSRKRPV